MSAVSTNAAATAEVRTLVAELKLTLDRVAVDALAGRPVNAEDAVVLRGSVESLLAAAAAALPLVALAPLQPAPEVLEANQARVRGDKEPCAVCGRPVRDVMALQVHLSERGNIYPTSVDVSVAASLPEGTMYLFPVGPDCAKKIPAGYLHVA